MKLDPEAFKRGKDKARADRQRVMAGREESGNAFLSGRELAIEDALASKAHIDALAVALRRGGLPGTLQQLRVLAFNDLTQGRDPRDRLTGPGPADGAAPDSRRAGPPAGGQPRGARRAAPRASARRPATSPVATRAAAAATRPAATTAQTPPTAMMTSWDGCPDMPEWQHERRGTTEDDDHHDGPGAPPGPPAPFPALINLTVPAGTAFGWSSAPGEAGGWGLTDPDDTRRLLQAASAHPRTRWCFTLLGPDGTAVAHGCARGPHPWIPPPASGARNRDGPDQQQAAALADFLRGLNVTVTPIAKGSCDHRNAEDRYIPSRKLEHLIRARTATCPAPGCGAHAAPQRPRPHRRLPRRAHRRMQHRPALPHATTA